jgi:hypothetical protein
LAAQFWDNGVYAASVVAGLSAMNVKQDERNMKQARFVLMIVLMLLATATGGVPPVQAQVEPESTDSTPGLYLPLVMGSGENISIPTPTPTPQWATQTKTKSGIHLGNRSSDWTPAFLKRIGYTADVYDLQRFDSLCQVSGASVKTVDGKAYELYRYLTEGVIHHHVKVVIRITPSPGNFSDFTNPGGTHVLLTDEKPPGDNDYCGDSNTKVHQYRDILDIAKEMDAIYRLSVDTHKWPAANLFFEPANEPNYEWYQRLVDDGVADLVPKIDNKQAWIDMDEYFAALYDRAIGLQPNLQILAPSMSQGLFGEHYPLGSCNNEDMVVVGGNGRTGLDFMKKVYGYDIWTGQDSTPKADGFAWHNYWRRGRERWLPPFGLPQIPPTVDDYCQVSDQYEPYSDHLFQYLSAGMQQSISLLPTFITEADLMSPCQLRVPGAAVSKDAAATETSDSLRTFITQEAEAYQNTGYGAQYVIAWLLVNQYPDEEGACRAGGDPQRGLNHNYEINWHEAYREDGQEREWFQLWWPATP